jgi:hypothetical protein
MKKLQKLGWMAVTAILALIILGCPQPTDGSPGLPYEVVTVEFHSGNDLSAMAVDEIVYVTFNTDMSPYLAEVLTHFTLTKLDGTNVPIMFGLFGADNSGIWFTPVSSLEYNTTYVFGTDVADEAGGYTFPLQFTTTEPIPGQPDDFVIADKGEDFITFGWTPASVAELVTRYRLVVQQGTTIVYDVVHRVENMTLETDGTVQVVVDSLEADQSYSASLFPGNDDTTRWGAAAIILTNTNIALDIQPPAITVTNDVLDIDISFTVNEDTNGATASYVIWSRESPSGTFVIFDTIASVSEQLAYTIEDTGEPDTTYEYYVQAKNGATIITTSNVGSVTTDAIAMSVLGGGPFSHAVRFVVASNVNYVVQANDGGGWVDVTEILPPTAGATSELVWSESTQFPYPREVSMRAKAVGYADTTSSYTYQPTFLMTAQGNSAIGNLYYLESSDRVGAPSETWVQIYLYSSQLYFMSTEVHTPNTPLMDGTFIQIRDSSGNVVQDNYSGLDLEDDDSGDGSYSALTSIRVPTNATYYVLVQSDILSFSPSPPFVNYDLTDYGWVNFLVGYIIQ